MPNFLINTDKKLKKILNEIKKSDQIGIDTEFIRESTYYPILALLQISTKKSNYCIDILEVGSKDLIKEILLNKKILKIMHSSKQDLEVLNRYYKCFPVNIFDTQIAASFLNFPLQISYQSLTEKLENVVLEKKHTRFDW